MRRAQTSSNRLNNCFSPTGGGDTVVSVQFIMQISWVAIFKTEHWLRYNIYIYIRMCCAGPGLVAIHALPSVDQSVVHCRLSRPQFPRVWVGGSTNFLVPGPFRSSLFLSDSTCVDNYAVRPPHILGNAIPWLLFSF